MNTKTIINIGELVGIVPEGVERLCGAQMGSMGVLRDAWLRIEDGRIADFGKMEDIDSFASLGMTSKMSSRPSDRGPRQLQIGGVKQASGEIPDAVIDAKGGMVMPAFCDSHTHLVYAGSREGEFLDKLAGLSYEEIAARGGGILNSSDLLHETSEDDLFEQSMVRVREVLAKGTAALEIKSGYGLRPDGEMKMLRVIARIRAAVPALVRATFLGAHAVGRGYTHEEYVREVIAMIPQAAELADYIDVFCDKGFFTVEDTDRILTEGARYGLCPKIHANELAVSGGVQIGVKHNALSVDHLERTTDAEIEALKGTDTMPVMLPGSSFFLGLPYGRARDFVAAGLPLALASDYNPGSSPSGDMRFVMALGCIKMKLTPTEALAAVTLNGAYAMGVSTETGSVTRGKRADLILTEPGWNLTRLAYNYTTPFIREVLF